MTPHCPLARGSHLSKRARICQPGQQRLRLHAWCTSSCHLLLLLFIPALAVLGYCSTVTGGLGSLRTTALSHVGALGALGVQADVAVNLAGYETWSLNSYPNPRLEPWNCGLSEVSVGSALLCDPDTLLAGTTRFAIQERLQKLRSELEYDIGVAVLDHLDPNIPNIPWWKTPAETFAGSLLTKWKLGDGHGVGVMLVVTRTPPAVSILGDHKAERRGLNTDLCKQIADYGALPSVEGGFLDRGIVSAVEEIAVALRHPSRPLPSWNPMDGMWRIDTLWRMCCVVAVLSGLACILVFCYRAEGVEDTPDNA